MKDQAGLGARETLVRYQEIENWLRDRVINGREGDPLPSEAELGARFGVSRMTARQAVQNLAAEGLVRRLRGSGTFIAPKPLHRHSGLLFLPKNSSRVPSTKRSANLAASLSPLSPGLVRGRPPRQKRGCWDSRQGLRYWLKSESSPTRRSNRLNSRPLFMIRIVTSLMLFSLSWTSPWPQNRTEDRSRVTRATSP